MRRNRAHLQVHDLSQPLDILRFHATQLVNLIIDIDHNGVHVARLNLSSRDLRRRSWLCLYHCNSYCSAHVRASSNPRTLHPPATQFHQYAPTSLQPEEEPPLAHAARSSLRHSHHPKPPAPAAKQQAPGPSTQA